MSTKNTNGNSFPKKENTEWVENTNVDSNDISDLPKIKDTLTPEEERAIIEAKMRETNKKLDAESGINQDIEESDRENDIVKYVEEHGFIDADSKEHKLKELGILRYDKKTGQIITSINAQKLYRYIYDGMELHFKTVVDGRDSNKELWWYDKKSGRYRFTGETKTATIVENLVGEYDKVRINLVREVIEGIKRQSITERSAMKPPLYKINCENGTYNLDTDELESHSPDDNFLTTIGVDYIKDAKCDEILDFVDDIMEGNEENIALIQEMFGYCLYRDYPIHVIFILYGTGRNGKGVLTRLLSKMLGKDSVSGESLEDLQYDRFATSSLYDKLANITAEVSKKALSNTDKIKATCGNDLISMQYKGGNKFQAKNTAKLIALMNELIELGDGDIAIYDRIHLIPFKKYYPAGKQDIHLLEKLTTTEEMRGLLKWSIEGLKRLLKNGRFTHTPTINGIHKYEYYLNPLEHFTHIYLDTTVGDETGETTDNMYKLLEKFVKETRGAMKITKNQLTSYLKKTHKVIVKNKGHDNIDCYMGIEIKKDKRPEGTQPILEDFTDIGEDGYDAS